LLNFEENANFKYRLNHFYKYYQVDDYGNLNLDKLNIEPIDKDAF